ncbi:ParA family protein [Pantoea ananatis]|uniref:ParA family protein n=1 Tax=Pantoea ananas TaxID=553 RepID=UPI001B30C2A9|nr:ParA family protein [Pantoea ananatis]
MTVIAAAHNKGGTGKTTSSVHIIGELRPDDVIDIDVHKGISVLNRLRNDDEKWPVSTFTNAKELMTYVQQRDDAGKLVYVDCGGFDSELTRSVVAIANLVIVPANDSPTELIGLASFDQVLADISKKIGFDLVAHVLLCKTPPNKKKFPEMESQLAESRHMKLLDNRLPYRTGRYGFQESLRTGQGITEIKNGRASPAGRELRKVVAEIQELLSSE